MAISVDTVYKTVLLILNKEQRGYLTPDEFNKIGNQVQLEIFEKYFEDLHKHLRYPEPDNEYADRVKTLEDNYQQFLVSNGLSFFGNYFTSPLDIHRLGSLQFSPNGVTPVEIQQMTQHEYNISSRSPLTAPSKTWPVFVRQDDKFFVYPSTINSDVIAYFIRKPEPIEWVYTVDPTTGAYIWSPASVDFELSSVDQTEVVLKILLYAGVVVRDPQIVQTAAGLVAAEDANETQ
jgi:hypothetical protein